MTVICTSDAGFIALKAPENVWRPGSAWTRWGSLSAPPDPLAAKGAGEGWKEGRGRGRQGKEKGRRGGGGEGKGREGGVEGKRRAPTYFAVIRPLVKSDLRWGYRAEKEV